jgi:hypothetical protein
VIALAQKLGATALAHHPVAQVVEARIVVGRSDGEADSEAESRGLESF